MGMKHLTLITLRNYYEMKLRYQEEEIDALKNEILQLKKEIGKGDVV